MFAVSGSLFAVRFDAATRTTIGDRVPILAGVQRASIVGATQFSVSTSGSLVYVSGPTNAISDLRVLSVHDRSGKTTTLKLPPREYSHPRASPDGARLAVATEGDRGADIWIYELAETSNIRQLTLDGQNRYPVWSSDGGRVAFQSDREGDRGIFWQPADGQRNAERLTTAPQDAEHIPESFSRDGRHLLFSERKAGRYTLQLLSMEQKTSEPFGKVTSAETIGATFAPDGRWVAYAASMRPGELFSSDRGVFIQPFPATGVQFPVPKVRIDFHPAWSRDGKSLFLLPWAPSPLVVFEVRTQPSVSFGPPLELPRSLPRSSLLGGTVRGYDTLPDGRIVTVSPAGDPTSTGATSGAEIQVVINWFEELKRLVPPAN